MDIDITTGIGESSQQDSFQNATLQSFGDRHAISIAVTLPDGIAEGIDADDQDAVRTLLAGLFASATERGCTVEAQVGPSRDVEDEE